MDNWKILSSERKMKELSKYSIIVPNNSSGRIPLECPVCHILMSSFEDIVSYQESTCCTSCNEAWVFLNKEKWKAGWRPSESELNKYINERNDMPSFIYEVK